MASALSSSFSETTIYLPDNVLLSPTDGEVHGRGRRRVTRTGQSHEINYFHIFVF